MQENKSCTKILHILHANPAYPACKSCISCMHYLHGMQDSFSQSKEKMTQFYVFLSIILSHINKYISVKKRTKWHKNIVKISKKMNILRNSNNICIILLKKLFWKKKFIFIFYFFYSTKIFYTKIFISFFIILQIVWNFHYILNHSI